MILQIPLDRTVDNPFQTRIAYDEAYIAELAESILRDTLLQPPVGRIVGKDGEPLAIDRFFLQSDKTVESYWWEHPDGEVQIAFGHNRLRAFRMCRENESLSAAQREEFATMPVLIRSLTDQEMALRAYAENARRKDISAVEEALTFKRMMDRFGWTQQQVAGQIGLDKSTVSNKLRLLRLPEEIQEHIRTGRMSERQATALQPAFELSEEEQAAAKRMYVKPDQILQGALADASSTWIRDQVRNLKVNIKHDLNSRRRLEASREKLKDLPEGVLKVDGLAWDSYTAASDSPDAYHYVPGCSPECACRRTAHAQNREDLFEVCIDPARRQKLKADHTRKERKKRRVWRDDALARYQDALIGSDGAPRFTREAVSIILRQGLVTQNRADIAAACATLGLPPELAGLPGWGEAEAREAAYKALGGLEIDLVTAARLILEVCIQEDLRNYIEQGWEPERWKAFVENAPPKDGPLARPNGRAPSPDQEPGPEADREGDAAAAPPPAGTVNQVAERRGWDAVERAYGREVREQHEPKPPAKRRRKKAEVV